MSYHDRIHEFDHLAPAKVLALRATEPNRHTVPATVETALLPGPVTIVAPLPRPMEPALPPVRQAAEPEPECSYSQRRGLFGRCRG